MRLLKGFVCIVLWILKALWIVLSEAVSILRRKKRLECSGEFYHRFMYIAPSSDYQLLTLNQAFKVILRKFWGRFWCSRVRMMYFFKRLMNIHSNQPILYYGFKLSSILSLKRPLTHYWTSPLKSPFFPAPSFHAHTHCHCHSLSLSLAPSIPSFIHIRYQFLARLVKDLIATLEE